MTIKKCPICKTKFKVSEKRNQITCSLKCRSKRWIKEKTFAMENNLNWKGGVTKYPDGYVIIKKPDHPRCDKNGYVREHRLVMEKHLNRFLSKKEVVHHINEIRDDNRIENLKVFKNNGKHLKLHFSKLGGYVPL